MQDLSRDDFDGVEQKPSHLQRLRRAVSTVVGAAVALVLLFGVGVWFYQLGIRDAENVPIIRAAVEPAKTRPDDPGGAVAPHQEVTSYRIVESEPAKASAAVIAPPPPQPRREDVAMGSLKPEPSASDEDAEAVPGQFDGTDGEAADDPDGDVVAGPAGSGSSFAPPRSPVVRQRPPDLLERMKAAKLSAEQSEVNLARRAAESPVQIQLAADPDETVIREMWRRIYQANTDLLRGRELAVQTTISGGTEWFRLRVGPFSATDKARAICQALKARGQDCIVARNG